MTAHPRDPQSADDRHASLDGDAHSDPRAEHGAGAAIEPLPSDPSWPFARFLGGVYVLPYRVRLETPGVFATVPMLRGVWGAALHDLDRSVYDSVFAPDGDGVGQRSPGYLLRAAPPDPAIAPAMDWILIGETARRPDLQETLWRAWDIASGMGLGPHRIRFHLRDRWAIDSNGMRLGAPRAWSLAEVRPFHDGDPGTTPLRLRFDAPVRLIRQGRLIDRPGLPDIIVSVCRRIRAFLPSARHAEWDAASRDWIETSRQVPAEPWVGDRLDLMRYSARQHSELELRGVAGRLDLPGGPGALWPLLAAAQWLHIGKGTVMGLGQPKCMRLPPPNQQT
ncbi:MAG: CRISPR system precrRNA processing endoribonuclease RAMP protein Cas6 [Planctomycetes bacterium]|nr:CRISPR system precrRNA processing endoribonuclease RAMP protein Cas6 [Planctomycetota bacterium]